MRISRMTKAELVALLDTTDDGDLRDSIYDELDRRAHEHELRDTTEEDATAAWNDRYEMWRNEY